MIPYLVSTSFFFFFNDTATTEIYTLSLHDALPILTATSVVTARMTPSRVRKLRSLCARKESRDRKSTRLNSSHDQISYAVFCLKKKKENIKQINDVKCHKANRRNMQEEVPESMSCV